MARVWQSSKKKKKYDTNMHHRVPQAGHLGGARAAKGRQGHRRPGHGLQLQSPMGNPYCSCKLTRQPGLQLQFPMGNPYCSCKLTRQPGLQLQSPMGNPYCSCKLTRQRGGQRTAPFGVAVLVSDDNISVAAETCVRRPAVHQ